MIPRVELEEAVRTLIESQQRSREAALVLAACEIVSLSVTFAAPGMTWLTFPGAVLCGLACAWAARMSMECRTDALSGIKLLDREDLWI